MVLSCLHWLYDFTVVILQTIQVVAIVFFQLWIIFYHLVGLFYVKK